VRSAWRRARFCRHPLTGAVLAFVIATTIPAASASITATRGQWSSGTDSGVGSATAVSCASSQFCEAVGFTTGIDAAAQFNGKRWMGAKTIAKYSGVVTSLSCPVNGWCAAITDLADVTTLRNGRWSKLIPVDPSPDPPYPGIVAALSCTAPTFCVAVDARGMSETYNGSRWSKPRLIDRDNPINDVSCGALEHCVVIDGFGRVLNFDDGRWSVPLGIDHAALTGVSCATATSCVAVDLFGRTISLNGGRWGPPTSTDMASATPLSISCPTAGNCIVADAAGRGFFRSRGRWIGPKLIDDSLGVSFDAVNLVDVACVHGSQGPCVAVDSAGNATENNTPFLVK